MSEHLPDQEAPEAAPAASGWTLSELTERVREALTEQGLLQGSGRVRDLPDARTARYYTTLGLLDRPSGIRNRRKLYGERHRQQLVAIKRLQAEGLSLAEVQERLLRIDSRQLADLARALSPAPAAAKSSGRKPFWKMRPRASSQPADATAPVLTSPTQTVALRMDGLTIVLDCNAELSPEDLEAVHRAARPLLTELAERGLVPGRKTSSQ